MHGQTVIEEYLTPNKTEDASAATLLVGDWQIDIDNEITEEEYILFRDYLQADKKIKKDTTVKTQAISSDSIGGKLMKQMGWKEGEGLGTKMTVLLLIE